MFLEFFNLRQQPFGVTPDPAYLFPSRTHCEALDALTAGILDGRGFLALIAEPGMGKTTLLYQVLEGMREKARGVYLFQTQCDSREFFQYLLSELGVERAFIVHGAGGGDGSGACLSEIRYATRSCSLLVATTTLPGGA